MLYFRSIIGGIQDGGGGQKLSGFCPCSGNENCPRRGVVVKKWQNSVHVVVENVQNVAEMYSVREFPNMKRRIT